MECQTEQSPAPAVMAGQQRACMIERASTGRPASEPPREPDHGAPGEVELATKRLAAALDALEAAVERRRDADRDEDELAARIHALGTDRSRLANELDGALVRSRELERLNREVSQKLDGAIATIRAVLDGEEP
jgi:hypothetical protein